MESRPDSKAPRAQGNHITKARKMVDEIVWPYGMENRKNQGIKSLWDNTSDTITGTILIRHSPKRVVSEIQPKQSVQPEAVKFRKPRLH